MKVMIIGGTGHIGRFLTPLLVNNNMNVLVVSRNQRPAPSDDPAWQRVTMVTCDTSDPQALKSLLNYQPDVVIDIPGTAKLVYETFKHHAKHLIITGSLWMFGPPKIVPTPEKTQGPARSPGYLRRYQEILDIMRASYNDQIAVTAIMPPNICGPGKIPLDCLGGRSLEVHKQQQAGQPVILPDLPDVLLGPCDAQDIAQLFLNVMLNRDLAAGQLVNVGSAYSLTAAELVQTYAEIFNVDIPIQRVPWQQYITEINPEVGAYYHFEAHMCPDITKAQLLFDYCPLYTPQQTLARAVNWMRQEKML